MGSIKLDNNRPLLARLAALHAEQDRITREVKRLEEALRSALEANGASEATFGDAKVLTYRSSERLRTKDIRELHPDLYEAHTEMQPVFDSAGFAAQHPELAKKFRSHSLRINYSALSGVLEP